MCGQGDSVDCSINTAVSFMYFAICVSWSLDYNFKQSVHHFLVSGSSQYFTFNLRSFLAI